MIERTLWKVTEGGEGSPWKGCFIRNCSLSFYIKKYFLKLEIHLTWFIRLKLQPVVYILYLQLIFLFCIELVIAWDKDIKMIKFTELITLHKFRFTIILIKSWQSVVGSSTQHSEIHLHRIWSSSWQFSPLNIEVYPPPLL